MLSTIVVGGDSSTRSTHLLSLLTPSTQLLHLSSSPTSIGIEAVHSLLSQLSLSASLPRIVWIEEANTLTAPAANSLLKILEEPPSNTMIYLTCDSAASLLPTIRSRCQITTLSPSLSPLTLNLSTIKHALSATAGDRLTLAASLPSDRAEAVAWLTALEQELHLTIAKTTGVKGREILAQIGRLAILAHTRLKSNVGVSLALGNFFLHLPVAK